ncbi:MAG: hypothetical protein ACYC4P_16955 [Thermoanaerobaculia bacterium]
MSSRAGIAFAACAFVLSTAAPASNPSSVTCNGVEMPVKAGVAVWDAKGTTLQLFLLPFEPTAAETERLAQGDTTWLDKRAPVDAKKWPRWNPHAYLLLGWSWNPKAAGDAEKLNMCTLFQHDVAKNAVNSFVDCPDQKLNGRLEGRLAAGESITVASRGEGKNGDYAVAWDFRVTTKVLLKP